MVNVNKLGMLLSAIALCLIVPNGRSTWHDTSIFMPSTIYVGQDASIMISTGETQATVSYKTSIDGMKRPVDNTEEVYQANTMSFGRYVVSIPYRVPFLPPSDRLVELIFNFTITFGDSVKYAIETVNLKRMAPLILGETEKPMYRPGEAVRARFITINQLPKPGVLPLKKFIFGEEEKPVFEALTEEEQSDMKSSNYLEVYVTSPSGERVKQWLKVSPIKAANLSYSLLADAPVGNWLITAERLDGKEVLSFTVEKYVLPRFTTSIQSPEDLSTDSNFTQYSVCSKYGNGPVMRHGMVRSRLCVCPASLLKEIVGEAAVKMMQSDVCPEGFYHRKRPCLFANALLSSADGCAQFNASTELLELKNGKYPTWNQHVHLCAEVEEEGTKSTVVRCQSVTKVSQVTGNLKLDLPKFYNGDLPFFGSVSLTSGKSKPIPNAEIRIEVLEYSSSCYRPYGPSKTSGYHYITIIQTDNNGVASFISPPVNSTEISIQVKAIYSGRIQGKLVNLRQSKTIRLWQHLGSKSLQIWPPIQAGISVTCPGEVKLRLIANTPLTDKTVYVHSTVRGKHLMQTIAPASVTAKKCEPRDDELGHYTCLSDQLQCLPGWTGSICMQLECPSECNPRGGSCLQGKRCVCREGWRGDSCETCVSRLNCSHGRCEGGNDCVCEPGWSGWNCDRKELVYEDLPVNTLATPYATSKPTDGPPKVEIETRNTFRQPIFERDVSIKLDSDWGPKASVVIFVYDNDFETSDIIGTAFELDGLVNCTSRAIALQSQSGEPGVAFNYEQASPGQDITLSIIPRGVSQSESNRLTSDLAGDVCFSRISDISLDNFGAENSQIYLKAFSDKLMSTTTDNHYYWGIGNLEGAFSSAGIKMSRPGRISPIYRHSEPCFYHSPMARMPAPGAPMEMNGPSGPVIMLGEAAAEKTIKSRLRDFFPEVWHFEVNPVQKISLNGSEQGKTYGVQKVLTVPDTLTSWRASAFCTTGSNGLWIGQQALLKVQMPFFIEITVPKEVKRGEILHLPVSLFVTSKDGELSSSQCYEVHVRADLDKDHWLSTGSTEYTGCVCEGSKATYLLGMIARRLGDVNVTVEASATSGSALCMKDNMKDDSLTIMPKLVRHNDLIRRAVRVVPEGKRAETTVGDILCLEKASSQISRQFTVQLPDNLVPDSVRAYVTYSDEVLGPALSNLDKLVQLPMGCGEQNMVLVAPNVYVLGYLKAVPRGNARNTEKLISRIRSHIVSGYHGQLKYRRNDGSFSAFGESDKEGSTWLTAFVLRVFGRAYQVDPSLTIDWSDLFNQTITFLLNRQDKESGCFIEKGYVLHSGMQSSVSVAGENDKNLLMTAYVLSAIVETQSNTSYSRSWQLNRPIEGGLRCIHTALNKGDFQSISTYAIAQLANVLTHQEPQETVTKNVQLELKRRQILQLVATTPMLHWKADQNKSISKEEDTDFMDPTNDLAANVEVTSYAYLTLSKMNDTVQGLLPIIRWLSANQKASGGFHSTQDTVLALEVISNFATQLGLSDIALSAVKVTMSPLAVSVHLSPIGAQLTYQMTEETSRTANQIAVTSISNGNQVNSVQWTVSASDPDSQSAGCLAVQTAFIYNVEVDDESSSQNVFDLQLSVRQHSPPPNSACTQSVLDVCLRLRDSEVTGMILITVAMVTGWYPVEDKILSQLNSDESSSLRKVEFDSHGKVSLYFDGFSQEEIKEVGGFQQLKRCVQLPLQQAVFVESPKPAVVTAIDYYATHRTSSKNYTLHTCPEGWGEELNKEDKSTPTKSTTSPDMTTATPPTPTCPNCDLKSEEHDDAADKLYNGVCSNYRTVLLIKMLSNSLPQSNATFTVITASDQIASWNGSLDRVSPHECACKVIESGKFFILFANSDLPVYNGDPVIHLASGSKESVLLPTKQALPILEAAANRWKSIKVLKNSTTTFESAEPNRWYCDRLETILRFVKAKLL